MRSALMASGVFLAMLAIAYFTGRTILEDHGPVGPMLAGELNRWDAPHYLRIAQVGYKPTGEDALFLVFFPLYPLAVSLAHWLLNDFVAAGILVSLASAVAAGFLLSKLALLDADDEEASRSLVHFFLFPTAYFLFLPYTEALFTCVTLASFLAARQRKWALAGVAGMLATACRIQGLAIFPALVAEAWLARKQAWRNAAWLLLVPLGFAAYLLINWRVLGSPLAFLEIQQTHWFHNPVMPWTQLQTFFNALAHDAPSAYRTTVIEAPLAAMVFFTIMMLAGRKWLRPSYAVFAWLAFLPSLFDSFPLSVPRYLLAIFPLFLVSAKLTKNPLANAAYTGASAALLGGLFAVYATGRWAF